MTTQEVVSSAGMRDAGPRAHDVAPAPPMQASPLLISVLGDVQCWVHGRSVPGLTRIVKRIVSLLAGWPGIAIHRDRIIEEVWGSAIPSDAPNSLQGHVAALRRFVGREWIATTEDGYALLLPATAVDAERFADLAERGLGVAHRGEHSLAHPLLMEARDLWRGLPFPDLHDAELVARRERLLEVYQRVRETILVCRLAGAGSAYEADEVVAWAKEEVARAPLRERRHEVLMEALIRADRPAEAIDAFQSAAAYLLDHGGIRPGLAMIDAYRRAVSARSDHLDPRLAQMPPISA